MERKTSFKPASLVILIGLPGSGKSTFAKILQEKLKGNCVVHFEYDQLIPLEQQKQFASEKSSDTAAQSWKQERKFILDNIDNYLNGNQVLTFKPTSINRERDSHVLIIDDNNYYGSMRHEYYQIARKHQIGFCQFYLNAEIELAKSLNESRDESKRIPEEVIEKMAEKLETPDPLKNSWEQFSFQIPVKNIESLKDYLEMSANMIEMTLKNPVKPLEDKTEEKEKDRAKCTASVIHQADKCLRKIVSDKICEIRKSDENQKKEDIQIKAKHFNAKKDELLEDLKTGFTTLPTNVVTGIGKKQPDAVDNLKTVINELYDLKLSE